MPGAACSAGSWAGERRQPPLIVRVTVGAEEAEVVSDLLWFHGAQAIGERAAGSLVELEAGYASTEDAAAAASAVGRGARVADVGPAFDAALDAWKAFARPVRVGRLHVRPPWLPGADDPPAPGERCVVLDPSRAFGSGSHPSTMACLRAVEELAAPGRSMLDVGCGSGVLAVSAAVLGASPVVAVDVEGRAVTATLANAGANGVRVDARLGSVSDVDGRFDLVLANIGASTIVELAPALAARARRRLVVAGFHADRAGAVEVALEACGLRITAAVEDGGWVCLSAQMQH